MSGFATAIEADGIVFRLEDPDHRRTELALWSDLDLGDTRFAAAARGWELRLSTPPVDRLEYLFDTGEGRHLDPGNPRFVRGAFGDHSELLLPGYRPPAWLSALPPAGVRTPDRVRDTPVGDVDLVVWSPAGTPAAAPLPVLISHDGPEMDAYGSLTGYAAAMVGSGTLPPLRVALLAPGPRDQRYAANPAYAAALVEHVVPHLRRRWPTPAPPVLVGQSLGALAALHAAWTHPDPDAVGGLFLQSGSFFTPELDPQESGYRFFAEVSGFVRTVMTTPAPRPIPTTLVAGTAEENYANNRAMAARLRELGLDVAWGEVRDGHTWTCWRDLLDPHLTDLLRKVWGG